MKFKKDVTNFVEARLVDGERVVHAALVHKAIFWRAIAVLVLAFLFGLFIAPELGVLLFIVAGLMALSAQARRSVFMLVLTNKRVLARYGLLQMDVVDIRLDKIESIELERMPTGMVFGYCTVVIMGTGNRYIAIPYVANGPAVRKAYNEIVLGDKD